MEGFIQAVTAYDELDAGIHAKLNMGILPNQHEADAADVLLDYIAPVQG